MMKEKGVADKWALNSLKKLVSKGRCTGTQLGLRTSHSTGSRTQQENAKRVAEARADDEAEFVAAGGKPKQARRYGEEKDLADKLAAFIKVMDATQLQLTVEFIEREWPALRVLTNPLRKT
jgi:hypothetical protein